MSQVIDSTVYRELMRQVKGVSHVQDPEDPETWLVTVEGVNAEALDTPDAKRAAIRYAQVNRLINGKGAIVHMSSPMTADQASETTGRQRTTVITGDQYRRMAADQAMAVKAAGMHHASATPWVRVFGVATGW